MPLLLRSALAQAAFQKEVHDRPIRSEQDLKDIAHTIAKIKEAATSNGDDAIKTFSATICDGEMLRFIGDCIKSKPIIVGLVGAVITECAPTRPGLVHLSLAWPLLLARRKLCVTLPLTVENPIARCHSCA